MNVKALVDCPGSIVADINGKLYCPLLLLSPSTRGFIQIIFMEFFYLFPVVIEVVTFIKEGIELT